MPSSSSSRPPRREPSPGISATTSSSSRRSATSATCPRSRRTFPRPTRARSGPASASTSTTTSSRSTWCRRTRRTTIKKLKALLKDADELYLATDEDREGEAIAWHLLEVLNPQADRAGQAHGVPRDHRGGDPGRDRRRPARLDRRLVDAQEARRILDRLYGYEVSPVLWKKVMPELSAGRVQSVATRIVVERERERMALRVAPATGTSGPRSPSEGLAGRRPACVRRHASSSSTASGWRPAATSPATARSSLERRRRPRRGRGRPVGRRTSTERDFAVRSVEPKPYRRRPAAPVHHLDLPAGGGPQAPPVVGAWPCEPRRGCTRRATSPTCEPTAPRCRTPRSTAARNEIRSATATSFLPDAPRHYTKKVKNAQEAHEAIRPAGDAFKAPDEVRREVPRPRPTSTS